MFRRRAWTASDSGASRSLLPAFCAASLVVPAGASTLYPIGQPTDEEQYHLELINRARANPAAEGLRLEAATDPGIVAAYNQYGVDLAMMVAEFAALPVRPPLAMNGKLVQAARGHSLDMFTHGFQSHTGTGGSTPGSRAAAAGYSFSVGENIYAFADSSWHAHAGFQVDWGPGGAGGMQAGRGHRMNIHGNSREIGIGLHLGSKTSGGTTYGPQLVTQNFSSGPANTAYVTGVVYHDHNGNAFYDPGEGLGGVTVNVAGAEYHAVTANSGGYTIPIPTTSANRTVTFSGPGIAEEASAVISGGHNVKVDLVVPYVAPRPAGSPQPGVALASGYVFTPVAGAVAHEWKRASRAAVPADGAENLGRVTASTSPGYNPVDTGVKHAGSASYHLAHPQPATQTLTYSDTFIVAENASISFRSRLGFAGPGQWAKVQISTDGGTSWQDVYAQQGTHSAGEGSFQLRNASLAAYAGREAKLRFGYLFTSGTYYSQTSAGVGWYIDDVTFNNVWSVSGETIGAAAASGFSFTPPASGEYVLSVRPIFPGRIGAFGPPLVVQAEAASAAPAFATWAANFEALGGLPAGAIAAAPEADANRDGVPNLLAYALGLSPLENAAAQVPRATVAGGKLTVDYQIDLAKGDVQLRPEVSQDLAAWFAPGQGGAAAGFSDVAVSTSGNLQTRRASVPVTPTGGVFLRLAASQP